MKTAIIYYSMSENTSYAADRIARILNADTYRIEPEKQYADKGAAKFFWGGRSAIMSEAPKLKPYEFELEKYDCIILGSPVWARTFAPPIRTFIKENAGIAAKKVAAFVCYSGGGADKALGKLAKQLHIDHFMAEFALIDPKDNMTADNDIKIQEFCSRIMEGK